MIFLQSSVRDERFYVYISIFKNIGGGVSEFLANRVSKRISDAIACCEWSSICTGALSLIGVEILSARGTKTGGVVVIPRVSLFSI